MHKHDPTDFRILRRFMKKQVSVVTVHRGDKLTSLEDYSPTLIARLVRALSFSSTFTTTGSTVKSIKPSKNIPIKNSLIKERKDEKSQISSVKSTIDTRSNKAKKKKKKSKHLTSNLSTKKKAKKNSSGKRLTGAKKKAKRSSIVNDDKYEFTSNSDSEITKIEKCSPKVSNVLNKYVTKSNCIDLSDKRKRISLTSVAQSTPGQLTDEQRGQFKYCPFMEEKDGFFYVKNIDRRKSDRKFDAFCSSNQENNLENNIKDISSSNILELINSDTTISGDNELDIDQSSSNDIDTIIKSKNKYKIKEPVDKLMKCNISDDDLKKLKYTRYVEKDCSSVVSGSDDEKTILKNGTIYNGIGGPDYNKCSVGISKQSLRREWRSKKCEEANNILYLDESQSLNSSKSKASNVSIAERKPLKLKSVRNNHIVRPSDSNDSLTDADESEFEKSVLIDTKEQVLIEPAKKDASKLPRVKSILKKSQKEYNERRCVASKSKPNFPIKSKATLKRERFGKRHFKLKVMQRTGMSEDEFENQSELDMDVLRSKYETKKRRAKIDNNTIDVELQTQSLDSSNIQSIFGNDSKQYHSNSILLSGPYCKKGVRKHKKEEKKDINKKGHSKHFKKTQKNNKLEDTGDTKVVLSSSIESVTSDMNNGTPSNVYFTDLAGLAELGNVDLNQNNSAKVC